MNRFVFSSLMVITVALEIVMLVVLYNAITTLFDRYISDTLIFIACLSVAFKNTYIISNYEPKKQNEE